MSHNPADNTRPSNWRARVRDWRRNNRRRANRLLTRLFGTTEPHRRPLAGDTRRILVVRFNRRLGNILFLTPMLQSLAAALPAATIDIVIQDPAHIPLLTTLPGVNRVWIQQRNVFAILGLWRRLRAQRYDLAIDPSGNSASNRLAVALCGARQRMGFVGRDQWLPLTHAAARAQSRHQAEQALELLAGAVADRDFEGVDTLAVYPNDTARAAAEQHWRAALPQVTPGTPVIGFFTRATGRKQLARDWWCDWTYAVQARLPQAVLLEILPPGNAAPLRDDLAHMAVKPLDELAAVLARLDAFAAADSGPMHLAAASGTPVVGLFRATSPARYAPLGQRCASLAGDALTVENAVGAVCSRLGQ